MTEVSLYDMHVRALKDAGKLLMSYLLDQCPEDQLTDRYDNLAPAQRHVLELGCGRTAVAQIERRLRDYNRRAEAERKSKLKKVAYPRVQRGAFERVGDEPESIGVVIGH